MSLINIDVKNLIVFYIAQFVLSNYLLFYCGKKKKLVRKNKLLTKKLMVHTSKVSFENEGKSNTKLVRVCQSDLFQ